MKKFLLTFICAAASLAAQAQQAPTAAKPASGPAAKAKSSENPASAPTGEQVAEKILDTFPLFDKSKVNPEDYERAKRLGIDVARDLMKAYETEQTPQMVQEADQARRQVDSIADAGIAKERAEALEFLGLDPQAQTGLYYFVSWSMPLEMLRSYAVEAMWSGGTLVFRGIPPGRNIGEFFVKDLRQLVYGKGAAANISLDPRLFDAYAVKTVPTIVFTTVKADMQCQGINPVTVKVGDKEGRYDTCPELDPSSYWKVSGAVTTSYALESFMEQGAKTAEPYFKALARGFQGQEKPGQEQKPFVGKWEDVLSPSQVKAAQEAAAATMNIGGAASSPAK